MERVRLYVKHNLFQALLYSIHFRQSIQLKIMSNFFFFQDKFHKQFFLLTACSKQFQQPNNLTLKAFLRYEKPKNLWLQLIKLWFHFYSFIIPFYFNEVKKKSINLYFDKIIKSLLLKIKIIIRSKIIKLIYY